MVEIFSRTNLFRGPLKAVILGWSGVAVDHGAFGSIQPYIDAFRESWVEISTQDVRQHQGLSYADHLLALLQSESVSSKWLDIYGAPPTEYDLDRLYRNIEQLMPTHVVNHAEPVSGLMEAVAEFRHRELKIGSTSSHSYGAMEALAEAAREGGYQPDAMVCSSDVPGGRPYPWMCYQNAINLEAYPLESLVKIGDTVPGIQEGLNAGMWTIGVLKTSSELGLTDEEITRADDGEIKQRVGLLEKKFFDAGAHFVVEGIRDCPAVIDKINQRLKFGEKP
ncbi:MAG: phosphonoacetaldehyde hydrolase [Syntrophobacteraceae bacterium]